MKVLYQEKKLEKYFEETLGILRKNQLEYLEQWKELSEEDKKNLCNHTITQIPIPIPLRKILDEAAGDGIIHFQLIF